MRAWPKRGAWRAVSSWTTTSARTTMPAWTTTARDRRTEPARAQPGHARPSVPARSRAAAGDRRDRAAGRDAVPGAARSVRGTVDPAAGLRAGRAGDAGRGTSGGAAAVDAQHRAPGQRP